MLPLHSKICIFMFCILCILGPCLFSNKSLDVFMSCAILVFQHCCYFVIRCYLHCGDIDSGLKIFEEYTSTRPPTAELFVVSCLLDNFDYFKNGLLPSHLASWEFNTDAFAFFLLE